MPYRRFFVIQHLPSGNRAVVYTVPSRTSVMEPLQLTGLAAITVSVAEGEVAMHPYWEDVYLYVISKVLVLVPVTRAGLK